VQLNTADLNLDRSGSAADGSGSERQLPNGAEVPMAGAAAAPPKKAPAKRPPPKKVQLSLGLVLGIFLFTVLSAWQHLQGAYSREQCLYCGGILLSMLGASSAVPCMMQAPAKKAGRPAGGSGGGGRKRGGREQLCKKYGQGFVWGQLNGWFKQTVRAFVSDPVHDPPLDSADLVHL